MMFEKREPETEEGIQDEITVSVYDKMQRKMRDDGHLPVDAIIESGIRTGTTLEIGPGPGYLGLEWLKSTIGTTLTGIEISPAMISCAEKNAADYNLSPRARYMEGNAIAMPFDDEFFDGVFSSGSLHEWEDPVQVFDEVHRVLKNHGRFCITDLRRDLSPEIYRYMYESCEPREISPGFETSVKAAYTGKEIKAILESSKIKGWHVFEHPYGLAISGIKQ